MAKNPFQRAVFGEQFLGGFGADVFDAGEVVAGIAD
jgi:hypothetical protein